MKPVGLRGPGSGSPEARPEPTETPSVVLSEVAILAAAGVAVGLGAAFYLTRKVQAQLFGLSPSDPATLGAAMLFLLTVALLAGFGPARRATTIDPNIALRSE